MLLPLRAAAARTTLHGMLLLDCCPLCTRSGAARTRIWQVDFVAQHQERHARQAVIAQQACQLPLRLGEALPVSCIHQVHNGINLRHETAIAPVCGMGH